MFRPCLAATSLILAAGPTRIALMIPASADSTAPRNELSSQGCTTMVVTVGTPLAVAIRRSYLDPGCFALASAGLVLIFLLRKVAAGPMTPRIRQTCTVDPLSFIHGSAAAMEALSKVKRPARNGDSKND